MGKNLIQQRRGKGSIFKGLKHQQKGDAKLPRGDAGSGIVKDIITNKLHSAPLLVVDYSGEKQLIIAPEGITVGDELKQGVVGNGNTVSLKDLPEGTLIHNIEAVFGDGGKFVRGSGASARIGQRTSKGVQVIMPSKKTKIFKENCRAAIGVVAGGGRPEKPFVKAGNKYKHMKAKHKQYPKVCGISMNAVAHPFGSKSSHIKGRPTQTSRHAPPGRKVGKIAPKRTGYKR